MSKKDHAAWQCREDHGKGEEYGCIWRHASGWGNTPCHYAMNGYRVTASRTELYNQDHRAKARQLGYATDDGAGKIRAEGGDVRAEAEGVAAARGKGKKFVNQFLGKFYGPMYWLQLHQEGWHYGHALSPEKVPKGCATHGVQKTFAVKHGPVEGYGAWYPYHHQYHHLVAAGAVKEFVVGDDDKAEVRTGIICASKWNINKEENIVLLPREEPVSRIVGLPAHCPWGDRSHPEFSKSLEALLKQVKESIDDAIAEAKCDEVIADVRALLDSAVHEAYGQVATMGGGSLKGLR
jgi:hypothetical protein